MEKWFELLEYEKLPKSFCTDGQLKNRTPETVPTQLISNQIRLHIHPTWEYLPKGLFSRIALLLIRDKIFAQLESQSGCFFLNKTLTCEVNKKNSHERIWGDFTTNLVKYISKNTKSRWILWGSFAQRLESLIENKESIIKAKHPAYFSYTGGQESEDRLFDFAKSSGIKEILCTTQPKLH